MKYEYLEDPKPCPNCRQVPNEYTGLCPPVFIGGISTGSWYGSYLQCSCGNKSATSSDLQFINKDWNERVIPMIEAGEGTFNWPHNHMTHNAMDIYEKICNNVDKPDIPYNLYDENGCEVNIDIDQIIVDIANYLDNEGLKIGDN